MDCPTPSKIKFDSAWGAKKSLKRQGMRPGRANSGKIEVYRCECGYYHLGHGNAISKRRVA